MPRAHDGHAALPLIKASNGGARPSLLRQVFMPFISGNG